MTNIDAQNLNYSFSNAEVHFLLQALNSVQLSGVESAKNLITMTTKLQNPQNKDQIEKETYEKLKGKFEK